MISNDAPTNVPAEVLDYLQQRHTLTVATATPSALPHAATMVYVNDGITLYFCTRPDTTTAQHIAQNSAVAFTIDEYNADWGRIRGIQGSGEARVLLSHAEIDRVVSLFKSKFSDLSDVRTNNLSVFAIAPASIQFINNEQTSGSGLAKATDWHRELVYNVFQDLPRQAVESVVGRLDQVQVAPGDVIVRQGAPADKFFIITDGEVEVVHEDGGRERTVARLQRGQFFGEMAILRDMPRTATVRAVEPTSLLAMDRDSFRGLVAQSLGTTENFDQVIQRRLSELSSVSDE